MIQVKGTTVNTILERLGRGQSATVMWWNCFFWRYYSSLLSIAKLSYLQRVVRKQILLFKLNILLHHCYHSRVSTGMHIQINDAMQFQESSALSPELLLTVYLFFWQVSWNSSLVSRTFVISTYMSMWSNRQLQRTLHLKNLYWITQ